MEYRIHTKAQSIEPTDCGAKGTTCPRYPSQCSGSIIPDTDLGGKVTALTEVFNGKTASIIFN